jgi:hypothetical protein
VVALALRLLGERDERKVRVEAWGRGWSRYFSSDQLKIDNNQEDRTNTERRLAIVRFTSDAVK